MSCELCGTTARETEHSEALGVTLCGPCFAARASMYQRGATAIAPGELPGSSLHGSANGSGPGEIPARSTWAPVDLGPVLAGDQVDEPPTALTRADERCLLYRGKVHGLHGEPEAGKGWIAMQASAESIEKDEHVAYFDFEDDARTATARLRALGVEDAAIRARFHYVRPNEPLSNTVRPDLELALEPTPSLVIVDGVTEALTLAGLNLSDNTEVATWLDMVPRWIRDATGAAVVLIDHVTKDRETRGRFAIGAQHKLAGVDVAYSIRVTETFGRGVDGRAEIRVGKDRPGHVRQYAKDDVVAEVRFASEPGGGMRVSVLPPDPEGWRPTKRMKEVSQAIEANPGLIARKVREYVGGRASTTDEAIRLLIAHEFVQVRKEGQASCHYSVRPYCEWDEPSPRVPSVSPASGHRSRNADEDRVPVSPPLGDMDTASGSGSRLDDHRVPPADGLESPPDGTGTGHSLSSASQPTTTRRLAGE